MSDDADKIIAVHPETLTEKDAVLFKQSAYGQGREVAHRFLEIMHQSDDPGAGQKAMEIILGAFARQEQMTPEKLDGWMRDFVKNVRAYALAEKILVYPKTRH